MIQDRLALRVRDYLYENSGSETGSTMSGERGRRDDPEERSRRDRYKVAPLHKNLKNIMFFA